MKTGITVHVGNPFRRHIKTKTEKKDWIIKCVETYFGIDLTDNSRKREIVFARQTAMLFLNTMTKMGVVRIGKEFNRHHASVIHAEKVISNLCENSAETRRQICEIKALLG
jgi:chromosomal replication initiator protein